MEFTKLDPLDRRLAHALKVDGRASFSLLGEVLGVSDQTVARRYQRLRSTDALRVVGLPGWKALGMTEWFIRIRCVPDAAMPVAQALARRTDSYWIQLASGGAEVICVIRPDDVASHEALLLQRLPRMPRILDVVAHQILRSYEPDPVLYGERIGGLDAAAVDRLRLPPEDGVPLPIDDITRRILAVLGRDGRTPYPELAVAAGCSESTVRRRLEALRRSGSLRFDVDLDHRVTGQLSHAMLWLSVLPNALSRIPRELASHPEVNFAAVITGPANVMASVTCADANAFYEYLANRIGAIEGVRQFTTAPVLHVVKRHGQPHLTGAPVG